MPRDHRTVLANIKRSDQLVAYLRDEMDWPITQDDLKDDDLFFDYTLDELGIDPKYAAKIQEIKSLRPLSVHQPWGVFFIKFEPKQLPVGALRRILSQVALKKRASATAAARRLWSANDLLFASSYGEGDTRQISFAHFSVNETNNDVPTLKVLGWDGRDTALHLDYVAEQLTKNLRWPDDENDTKTWREQWRAAFTEEHREAITTSKALATELASLARSIRGYIKDALEWETEKGVLTQLMNTFREALIHDLDKDGFADMYAQTITYGLLSARITNPAGHTADNMVSAMPVTNPFLKELMETFLETGGRKRTGPKKSRIDFDELGVTDVVELLNAAKMEAVVRDFGDQNPQEDPVIHFYEHFLAEYDAKTRMQRGVFYTPRPVASFIVRSVDELVRTEFGLEDGLADTTTWGQMAKRFDGLEIPEGATPDQAFIQILDPATGTGTFLVEVIDVIHKTMTEKWKAEGHGKRKVEQLWNEYVSEHLLPRLHGYELMMAPYAVAHMKIGLKLYETGYRFESDERARVYLTNALEPAQDFSGALAFAIPALALEAQAVNAIKKGRLFTVVIGNPPYAQYSMNLNDRAKVHIEKFRFANGSRIRVRNALQFERNINDDYIKFLGFAVDRLTGCIGVMGMITNRMFLDSESLVGLRECFVENFDNGMVLDLHGSAEEAGRVAQFAGDKNVFDIRQGVAVTFLTRFHSVVRKPKEWRSRKIIGNREHKYASLMKQDHFNHVAWSLTKPKAPHWWLDRESRQIDDTLSAFTLDTIFPSFSTLVASNRDHFVVGFNKEKVADNITAAQAFKGSNEDFCRHFRMTEKKGWNITRSRDNLRALNDVVEHIRPIEYRPFDQRWIFFHETLVWQSAPVCSKNVIEKKNLVLVSLGKNRAETVNGQWITSGLADKSVVTTRDNASGFPLYLYDDSSLLSLSDSRETARRPNLDRGFLAQLAEAINRESVGNFGLPRDVCAEDIQNYIYALIYSPSYRSYYAEKLTEGFPPIPLPCSLVFFKAIATHGRYLTDLHIMRTSVLENQLTLLFGTGKFTIEQVSYSDNTVWIDKAKTCGFQGIESKVWNFHIGGYQICEKWLKDRQAKGGKHPRPGHVLTDEDIDHYQNIIAALSETIRTMTEIDNVIDSHGGWPEAFQKRS